MKSLLFKEKYRNEFLRDWSRLKHDYMIGMNNKKIYRLYIVYNSKNINNKLSFIRKRLFDWTKWKRKRYINDINRNKIYKKYVNRINKKLEYYEYLPTNELNEILDLEDNR